jgi:adhesin/invasin
VSNQNFSITTPSSNTQIVVGTAQPIAVSWTASSVAQAGTVTFAASRGTLSTSSATLATDGTLTPAVTLTSTTAGPSTIEATAGGVSAQVTVDFVATAPNTVALQASPSTINVQGQSTITATVDDVNGNPVQGVSVNFTIVDPTGGSLSSPTGTTNAQGQATITYMATTTASATNGVQITAEVQGTSISKTTDLTVGGQTVFLSLGTGNSIIEYSITQYALPYTVQAVDAAGQGLANVAISFTVTPVAYLEGERYWDASDSFWQTQSTSLPTDGYAYTGVPIYNGYGCQPATVYEVNGQIVSATSPPTGSIETNIPGLVVSTAELGTSVTGITTQQSATTASDGTASVSLIYPKDHAYYVAVALTATATVEGSQNSTTAVFWVPGAAGDFDTETVAPPGPVSPYGSGVATTTTTGTVTTTTYSVTTCYPPTP